MIAALFVERGGVYFGLTGVDPWDEARDARLYAGPWPVVAHPPCERWGRYATGGPNPHARRRTLGDDGGCFAAALAAVRTWGGVLEHPEASHAWRAHGLIKPPWHGGWVSAGDGIGWTCNVEQGHYGHPARKATWLYAVRAELPALTWGRSNKAHPLARLDAGFHSKEERRRSQKRGTIQRLSKRQAKATPPAFRDLLISIARSASAPPQNAEAERGETLGDADDPGDPREASAPATNGDGGREGKATVPVAVLDAVWAQPGETPAPPASSASPAKLAPRRRRITVLGPDGAPIDLGAEK